MAFSHRYTVLNIVISDVGMRFSSTLIIFVTSNHVEDKRNRDYISISGDRQKASWEENETGR